jgi:hypothetical protein
MWVDGLADNSMMNHGEIGWGDVDCIGVAEDEQMATQLVASRSAQLHSYFS